MPGPVIHQSEAPQISILRGPNFGKDLMKVKGSTPQSLARNAAKVLWTKDELKQHMLSPRKRTSNSRAVLQPRTDFSPTRKAQLKGYISETFAELFVDFLLLTTGTFLVKELQ